ncbi:MAG: hypothetical protein ABFC84_04845 [Veillonellales bacterium]
MITFVYSTEYPPFLQELAGDFFCDWRLVFGCWRLAAGTWLLGLGSWDLAVGCSTTFCHCERQRSNLMVAIAYPASRSPRLTPRDDS